ncbi:hypothetical protein ACIBQ1_60965 [Nonomuraea sp. NPDC050153]|uniref:hypothetical protein n=1 Tax=Nonomuraea sp. NPDC050153 TaxID=3364359 RepID=UPI00378B5CF7
MTGPWRTPRGSIAFVGVMGLVLLSLISLSLMLTGAAGRASGDGPTAVQGAVSGPVWSLGGVDADLSSLPPQAGSVREHHVLSLWPPLRGERHGDLAHLALLPSPGSDADTLRDPQQLAHRTAGSRSPPRAYVFPPAGLRGHAPRSLTHARACCEADAPATRAAKPDALVHARRAA